MHRANHVVGGLFGDYLFARVRVVAALGEDARHGGEVAGGDGFGALLGVDVYAVVHIAVKTLVGFEQVRQRHIFGVRRTFRLVDGAIEAQLLAGELVQIS